MKAKLYKGPFNGKSYDTNGRDYIVVRAPKRLTREQQYTMMTARNNYSSSDVFMGALPIVEAEYRIAYRLQGFGDNLITAPCRHPDGSIFYEYVEGSKREVNY